MMPGDWIEALIDATAIRAIFGDSLPSGENLTLHEIRLHRDGPEISLRLDFPEYPSNPPNKWLAAGFNRVQVVMSAFAVSSVSIQGLSTNMIVDLSIERRGPGLAIKFVGSNILVEIMASGLAVDKISGYSIVGEVG